MSSGLKMTHSLDVSMPLRFKHPFHCDMQELESVLDCYSACPEGFWPVRPELAAPLSHYEGCKAALDILSHRGKEYATIGEYLRSCVDDEVRECLDKVFKVGNDEDCS
jgi:hypothetical protein